MTKRKHDDILTDSNESDDSSNSSSATIDSTDVPHQEAFGKIPLKKKKKSVAFKDVTVYYFARKQGFSCVPSQGGSTLGMHDNHMVKTNFSFSEYALEKKKAHHRMFVDQLKAQGNRLFSDCDGDVTTNDCYVLQPLAIKQRRSVLRTSGIKKIENSEKEENRDIRLSREKCGCDCKVSCEAETCACSLAGIQCQVDRMTFPCACVKETCANTVGRIEFNPMRVRTHLIHTLMRLQMEAKQETINTLCSKKIHLPKLLLCQPTNQESKDDDITDIEEQYNSNEKGSCCDCQNSAINDVIMLDIQQGNGGGQGSSSGLLSSCTALLHYEGNENESVPSSHSQVALVLSSSEDEDNGPLFSALKEDSSCSESSDGSSEDSYQASYQDLSNFCSLTDETSTTPEVNLTELKSPIGKALVNTGRSQGHDPIPAVSVCKLEPISQILTPLRYSTNTIQSTTTGGWSKSIGSNGFTATAETVEESHDFYSSIPAVLQTQTPVAATLTLTLHGDESAQLSTDQFVQPT